MEESKTVNLSAQRTRHKKVFLRSRIVFRFILDIKSFLHRPFARKSIFANPSLVTDPFRRLVRQSVVIGVALLIVTSIAPSSILETGFTADSFEFDTDFIEEGDELQLPPFLMNEEGFMLKTSPVSEDSSRIGFTDSVKHTVASGDNLSTIAALYGISVKTLVWENNISESSTLKIGQTLLIPALDGVSYTVTSAKETLSGIAKSYSVDAKLIATHNNLEGNIIQKGQKLFIPGGKKKEPVISRSGTRSGGRIVAVNTFDPKVAMSSDAAPREGKELIFPTNGKLTQGYRGGHLALDIGNATKPDIWSADLGTVVTADGGCPTREERIDRGCGRGYGNYVVVDHGDGIQTLYAHLETVYVSAGQAVDRGQALGKMGNTGRAYGKTGIHLHFEVFDNGVKKNPNNYF